MLYLEIGGGVLLAIAVILISIRSIRTELK